MHVRRAATLVMQFSEGETIVHNFITGDQFSCSPVCLEFLGRLTEWHDDKQLCRYFPDADLDTLDSQISQLIECGALVVKGTANSSLEDSYRQEWQWGAIAGLYHFGVRGTNFVHGDDAKKFMEGRVAKRASPPLYISNTNLKRVIPLPRTDLTHELFAVMRKRRSERIYLDESMSLTALADCLFTGNGIVELRPDVSQGELPISMTASGGARNPYELYVYARNVGGLDIGFYHYAAREHDLGLIRLGKVNVSEMLGGQQWPESAAAIIFFVAHFPRSMWKYPAPVVYRAVLMEAGFIGQNIALTATHYGLSAVPSAALNEKLIESYLGTPPIESAVMLSITCGKANGNLPSTL